MAEEGTQEREDDRVGWEEIGLDNRGHGALLRGVHECGFEQVTRLQWWTISLMMDGYDVVLHDQSGLGKSTAVTVGALQRLLTMLDPSPCVDESRIGREEEQERGHHGHDGVKAVFIMPGPAEAQCTYKRIERFTAWTNIRCLLLRSNIPVKESVTAVQKGGIDVLVCTLGRLRHMVNNHVLTLDSLRIVVIIELDELISRGYQEPLEEFFTWIPRDRVQTAWTSNPMIPRECEELTRLSTRRPVMVRDLMRSILSPPHTCTNVRPTD